MDKTIVRTALKFAFGILLVVILIERMDWHAIGTALAHYTWPGLLTGLILLMSSWPVAALRWKLFATRIAFLRLLELTLIGQFYAIVLPGQLAGELVKAYRLAKGNVDAERLAASVAVDRIIGTIALLVVASAGLFLSRQQVPSAIVWLFAMATLALIASLFALRLTPVHRLTLFAIGRLEGTRFRGAAESLHRAVEAWRDFSRKSSRLLTSLALGIVFQLLGTALFATLGGNLGLTVSMPNWAWIQGVVSLAVLIPVSVGGIGLREGAVVGCLTLLDIAPERALALSFGIFAITLAGALAGGVLELIEATRKRA